MSMSLTQLSNSSHEAKHIKKKFRLITDQCQPTITGSGTPDLLTCQCHFVRNLLVKNVPSMRQLEITGCHGERQFAR